MKEVDERLLSKNEMYDRLDRVYDGDIRENIPFHEYGALGVEAALLEVSDNGFDISRPRESYNRLVSAYRIGGMHINMIDRVDDAIDGERNFTKVENPAEFLDSWVDYIRTGDLPEYKHDSERVAYEAVAAMRDIMSPEGLDEYADIFEEVVDNEIRLARGELEGRKEYLTHLDSGGLCVEALAIPMAEITGYPRENSEKLYEIGRFFQAIDDLQDLDEDSYEITWDEIRDIQEECKPKMGSGLTKAIMTQFGTWFPRADKWFDLKQRV